MKLVIASLALYTVLISSALAAPVFLYPKCHASYSNAICTLWNSSGKEISCKIVVRAQTQTGKIIYQNKFTYLYPSMSEWVTVYSSEQEDYPFVSIYGDAYCDSRD